MMPRMAKVVLLGAGMMGSALAVPMADRGHDVRLVGTHLDARIVERLREDGVHPKLGLPLPAGIRPFSHDELAAAFDGADLVALGVSSAGIAWATERLAPHVRPGMPVVMITKGLVHRDGRLVALPDVVRAGLPPAVREHVHPAAIAGPCIAGELARRVPTCVVVAGRDAATNEHLAGLLSTPYYHLFPTTDVAGAETCAALKNAYAMGIAFAIGLHERGGGAAGSVAMHNLESAVFAQAVLEMRAIVAELGGSADTASGLAGVGDLDVTTNGGRTGRFGRLLGLGLGRDEAVLAMEGATLECLEILASMREALDQGSVGRLRRADVPLLSHLVEVALEGRPVDVPLARFFRPIGEAR